MPLVFLLTAAIDLFFVVHALRTGRPYWWIFVIFAFPVMGCVIYFLVEIFPHSRESVKAERAVRNAVKGLGNAIDPTRDLRQRAADVELCGSVENRLALAHECLAANLAEDAVKVVQSCLNGPFANDPHLKQELAAACLAARQFDLGQATVDDLSRNHPSYRAGEIALLRARLFEEAGQTEPALSAYAEAVQRFVGEEARCRYALLLARSGHADRARELYAAIVANADRLDRGFRDMQREWIRIARRELAPRNS